VIKCACKEGGRMGIILIVVGVSVLVLGFYLKCQFDSFPIKNGGTDVPKVRPDLLIYGQFDDFEVESNSLANHQFAKILTPNLENYSHLYAVVAIGENDIENLMLCTQAKRKNSSCLTIALCNEIIYEKLFHDVSVDKVIHTSPSAEILADLLRSDGK